MRISRSRLENFFNCERCGWLEIRHGIRAPSLPFNLNIAVDELLKKDFDQSRREGSVPPVLRNKGFNFVPFSHPNIEAWRDTKRGLERKHEASGITVYGALDDLWLDEDGSIMVVDYKATAKDQPVKTFSNLGYHDGYKRQLDFYSWMMAAQGITVSPRAFIFYVTARKSAPDFSGKLIFDPELLEHQVNTDWIEPFLERVKITLESGKVPAGREDCRACDYRLRAAQAIEGSLSANSPADSGIHQD